MSRTQGIWVATQSMLSKLKKSQREPKERAVSKPRRNPNDRANCTCYGCGEVGNIRAKCPKAKKKAGGADFTFAIKNRDDLQEDHWIFDSGSSRHLVNDLSLWSTPKTVGMNV